MRQLSGQDAGFLYLDEPNSDMHGTLMFIYDPSTAPKQPVGFKDILRHVQSRLAVSPIFRQRLQHVPFDLDFPYWVDDECFDIEYHVRHIALPKPCDWRQFYILVSRLNAPPLNMQRPLWEMVVIEGLDNCEGVPKGSFALLIKGHHCAMDGHSAAELTMGLHDLSLDGAKHIAVPQVPFAPGVSPGLLTKVSNAMRNNVTSPLRLIGPVKRALPGLTSTLARFAARSVSDPQSNPVTRFNGKRSPHRVFALKSYPLDEVKRIRKAVPGATVNDCVLSIAAGAVREYLKSKKELPKVSLRVLAPINTRTEDEFGQAGNRISAFFPEVHTEIADPIARLTAVYESTRHAKQVADGIGAREMTDIALHSPAAVNMLATKLMVQTGLMDSKAPLFHFGLSNAPGPTVPMYLCGAKMLAWTVMVPCATGLGLGFAVTSYIDRLTIAFTADREAVSDPEFLEACVERSYQAHVVAANKAFSKQPDLLVRDTQLQRRAHPGLVAMQQTDAPASIKAKRVAKARSARP
jgi:WS/DGAT/MGAT family acyltransferase